MKNKHLYAAINLFLVHAAYTSDARRNLQWEEEGMLLGEQNWTNEWTIMPMDGSSSWESSEWITPMPMDGSSSWETSSWSSETSWSSDQQWGNGESGITLCPEGYTLNADNICEMSWSETSFNAQMKYIGCFVDAAERTLPRLLYTEYSSMNAEECIQFTRDQNYKYAGLQNGGECFGGDSLPPTQVDDSECNQSCPSDQSVMCGGQWRNSVYITNDAGTSTTEEVDIDCAAPPEKYLPCIDFAYCLIAPDEKCADIEWCQPMAKCANTYTEEVGYCKRVSDNDYEAGLFTSVTAINESECKEACTFDITCVAAEWTGSSCYLFQQDPISAYHGDGYDGKTCFLKDGVTREVDTGNTYTEEVGNCKRVSDNDYDGGLFTEVPAQNESECKEACTNDSNCAAAEWTGSSCYLFQLDPLSAYHGYGADWIKCFLKDGYTGDTDNYTPMVAETTQIATGQHCTYYTWINRYTYYSLEQCAALVLDTPAGCENGQGVFGWKESIDGQSCHCCNRDDAKTQIDYNESWTQYQVSEVPAAENTYTEEVGYCKRVLDDDYDAGLFTQVTANNESECKEACTNDSTCAAAEWNGFSCYLFQLDPISAYHGDGNDEKTCFLKDGFTGEDDTNNGATGWTWTAVHKGIAGSVPGTAFFERFDDHTEPDTVRSVTVRAGSVIDAILWTTGDKWTNTVNYESPQFGGMGGSVSTFDLEIGESITNMEIAFDDWNGYKNTITGIKLWTDQGRDVQLGQFYGDVSTYEFQDLVGFAGSSGSYLYQLGPIVRDNESTCHYYEPLMGCVSGENIELIPGVATIEECQALCSDHGPACIAVEYYVDLGTNQGNYVEGDCQLSSSDNIAGCDYEYYSLLTWSKKEEMVCAYTNAYDDWATCPPGWVSNYLGDGGCYRETWSDAEFYCPPGWLDYGDGATCFRDYSWEVPYCPDGWYTSLDGQSCYKDGWVWGDACPEGWDISADGYSCYMSQEWYWQWETEQEAGEAAWGLEACSGDYCAGYRGWQSRTVAGAACLDWAASSMTPDAYPAFGLEANYCRNPDASRTIWCYTVDDPATTWDYCEPIAVETVDCPAGWWRTDDGQACMTQWTSGPQCPPGWMLSADELSCSRDYTWYVSCPDGWTMSEDGLTCWKAGWVWGEACPDGWMLSEDGMSCSLSWQEDTLWGVSCQWSEIILEDGSCQMCPDYMTPDLNQRTCTAPACDDDRDYITADGQCWHCDDYTAPSADGTSCEIPYCDEVSVVTVDGGCQSCPTGFRPHDDSMHCISASVAHIDEEHETCSDDLCSGYRGYQSFTISGKQCQPWAAQAPQEHSRNEASYPGAGLDRNYCRNPDGEESIWCYTMDSETRWELCAPLELVEGCSGEGCSGYRGYQSQTIGGLECQAWASQEPHEHGLVDDELLVGNYCRNPDGEPSVWCYTMDPEVRWDYCEPILNTEECTGTACANYRGFQTYTTGGRQCQAWAEQAPHQHENDPSALPNEGLVGNYCRNPDGGAGIGCYTVDPETRWEACEPLAYDVNGHGEEDTFITSCPDGWIATGDGMCSAPCPEGYERRDDGVCFMEYCPEGYEMTAEGVCQMEWSRSAAVCMVAAGQYCGSYEDLGYVDIGNPAQCGALLAQSASCPSSGGFFTFSAEDGHCDCCLSANEAVTDTVQAEGWDIYRLKDAGETCPVVNTFGTGLLLPEHDVESCHPAVGGDACERYRGSQTRTRGGLQCQSWAAQSPQEHSFAPRSYPDSGLDANFCRNPDPANADTLWCYTNDPDVRWDYCDPIDCSVEYCDPITVGDVCDEGWTLSADGLACERTTSTTSVEACSGELCGGYRGAQTFTTSGLECMPWGESSMTPEAYPDFGLEANYCRNPDASNTIWCYTYDADITWEYCEPMGGATVTTGDVSCPPGWTMTEDRTACTMTTWTEGEAWCPDGWIMSADQLSCSRDYSWSVQCPPGWTLTNEGASCYYESSGSGWGVACPPGWYVSDDERSCYKDESYEVKESFAGYCTVKFKSACNNYWALGVTDKDTCAALVSTRAECANGGGFFNYVAENGQCDCCQDEADATTDMGDHYSVDFLKLRWTAEERCEDIETPVSVYCPPGWHSHEDEEGCYNEMVAITAGYVCPPGLMLDLEAMACVRDAGFLIACPPGWQPTPDGLRCSDPQAVGGYVQCPQGWILSDDGWTCFMVTFDSEADPENVCLIRDQYYCSQYEQIGYATNQFACATMAQMEFSKCATSGGFFTFSFLDNHCDCCLSEAYVFEDMAYGEYEALFKHKASTQDCPGAEDTGPLIPYPEQEPDYAAECDCVSYLDISVWRCMLCQFGEVKSEDGLSCQAAPRCSRTEFSKTQSCYECEECPEGFVPTEDGQACELLKDTTQRYSGCNGIFCIWEHDHYQGEMQEYTYGRFDCGDFGPLIDQTSSFEIAEGAEVVLYEHCFDDGANQIKQTIQGHAKVGLIEAICQFPNDQLSAVEIRLPVPKDEEEEKECSCLEYLHSEMNECMRCPAGSRVNADNNGCDQAPQCFGWNIVIGDESNCYDCRTCPVGFVADPEGRSCIAYHQVCGCTEMFNQDLHTCEKCPFGQTASEDGLRCIAPPTCDGWNEYNGIEETCFQCRQCPPGYEPNEERDACHKHISRCGCTEVYKEGTWNCESCPDGWISSPDKSFCLPAPKCLGYNQYLGGADNCHQCSTCPAGWLVNPERSACYIVRKSCSCTERFELINGEYQCSACPVGTVSSYDKMSCEQPQTCDGLNQYLGDAFNCYQCRTCPQGWVITDDRRSCYRPQPKCGCTQKFNWERWDCEACAPGYVAAEGYRGCVPAPDCHGHNEYHADADSCYQCQTCIPGWIATVDKHSCTQHSPTCSCHEIFSEDYGTCVSCPPYTIASVDKKTCVPAPECDADHRYKGDATNCYQCRTCADGLVVSHDRKTCAIEAHGCHCTEQWNEALQTCVQCAAGYVASADRLKCVLPPSCNGYNEYRGDHTNCYQCLTCSPGHEPHEDNTRCVPVKPKCSCTERFQDNIWSCVPCQRGWVSMTDKSVCVPAEDCHLASQYLGDASTCYQCKTCRYGFVATADQKSCHRQKPVCDCSERFRSDIWDCEKCPAGQVSDPYRTRCMEPPACRGTNQIYGDASDCFKCTSCEYGWMPSYDRTYCERKPPACGCNQRFQEDIWTCVNCPAGHIATNNNRDCIPAPECYGNQIMGQLNNCYQCITCPNGQIPDQTGKKCIDKPMCSCTQRLSADKLKCLDCPPRYSASLDGMQCLPAFCTDPNTIIGEALDCYKCIHCPRGYVPDEMNRKCIKLECSCTEKFVYSETEGSKCVECPDYQIAVNGNAECVPASCPSHRQIIGSKYTCHQCHTCERGRKPDANQRECNIPPEKIECDKSCLHVYDWDSYTCIRCPQGYMRSWDFGVCVPAPTSCHDYRHVLGSEENCYQCTGCPDGHKPSEDQKVCEKNQDCRCDQRLKKQIKECISCQTGLIQSNNIEICTEPAACIGPNQYKDETDCYRCRECTHGRIPKAPFNLECECPKGLFWNEEYEECLCPDPERMSLDRETLQCSCPPEFSMVTIKGKHQCVCPNNMIEATRTEEAMLLDPSLTSNKYCTCPMKMEQVKETNSCVCPFPQVVTKENECACPDTMEFSGSSTTKSTVSLMKYGADALEEKCVCKRGMFLNEDKASCSCYPDQIPTENGCKCKDELVSDDNGVHCCYQGVKDNSPDQSTCTCAFGMFLSEDKKTCERKKQECSCLQYFDTGLWRCKDCSRGLANYNGGSNCQQVNRCEDSLYSYQGRDEYCHHCRTCAFGKGNVYYSIPDAATGFQFRGCCPILQNLESSSEMEVDIAGSMQSFPIGTCSCPNDMVRDEKGMCVYGHLDGIVQFFQYLSFKGMRTTLTKGLYDCDYFHEGLSSLMIPAGYEVILFEKCFVHGQNQRHFSIKGEQQIDNLYDYMLVKGEGWSHSSFIIRGGEEAEWEWSSMSTAWFYLYYKGTDMKIDFSHGEMHSYSKLGDFDAWRSSFQIAGGMRIEFYDSDGTLMNMYYGPDTVFLGEVFPFDSFQIFASGEEYKSDVAKFTLGGDYYGQEITFGYGNYDCGQLGTFDNYDEFVIDSTVEVFLYSDCLGTAVTHKFEGPITIDIEGGGHEDHQNAVQPWKSMEVRRLRGSIHYPLSGFTVEGAYYGFKQGLHQCPYFPEQYWDVEVTLPSDLEIVFENRCEPRYSYDDPVVYLDEGNDMKIHPGGSAFTIRELVNVEYQLRSSSMTSLYVSDGTADTADDEQIRMQMLLENDGCFCTQIFTQGECHECPAGLVAERGRCVYPGTCQAHEVAGTAESCYRCQACGAGTAPDFTKTRCVAAPTQAATSQASCTGDREIYNWDRTACIECNPYARAQRGNTVCLPDACGANEIVTEQGTCTECGPGTIPDASRRSCNYPGSLRLNALTGLEGEPTVEQVTMPEANEIKAAKKRSFPTVLVAGVGILVLALTAAAGLMCCKARRKATSESENIEQELPAAAAPSSLSKMMSVSSASKADEMASIDHLVAAGSSVVAPAEELARPEAARGSSESGSPKSSTEDSK